MGLRFRRSIKIAPGVRVNLSRSGVSTSIGPRGAKVTIGHGQVRETVGIPGTGLSYTETHRTSSPAPADASSGVGGGAVLVAALAMIIVMAAGGSFVFGIIAAIAIYFLAQVVKGFRAGAADSSTAGSEPFTNQAELEAMKSTFEQNKGWFHERFLRANQAKASGKLGEFPHWYFDPVTQPQLDHLARMHVKVTDTDLTKGSASDLIGLFEPMDEGDAEVLRFFHVDVPPEQRNETRGRMEVAHIFADPLNRAKWEERQTTNAGG